MGTTCSAENESRRSSLSAPPRSTYASVSPGVRGPHWSSQSGYPAPPPAAVAVPPSGVIVSFSVKQVTGEELELAVDSSTTIAEVKSKIEEQVGVPRVQQRLIFAGRQLDDAQTLSFYSIAKGTKLMLAVRKPKTTEKPGLQDLLDLYEVTVAQSADLQVLSLYDIVFLVDDSGSMNHEEVTAGVRQTRWKELRNTVGSLIEFATYFDDDGTDIHFLNREPVEGVSDSKDPRLDQAFGVRPRGSTPLARRLQEVVLGHPGKKPLLLVLATDGEPDEGVKFFVETTRRLLTMPQRDVRLAVMACTQDERAVQWLNQLDDDPMVGGKVDVCDDFESEREQILRSGKVPQFLLSDYYVKALLGPISAKYDNMD